MPQRILVVDDDPITRKLCKNFLEEEGFDVSLAEGVEDGLRQAEQLKPDLVLADVVLPEADGFELVRRVKNGSRTSGIPVILMSGILKAEQEQVEGMEQGADDYVLKPFSLRLMAAKVRAVLRRYAAPGELQNVLQAKSLSLDVQARTVAISGRRVTLTRKEFDLLTTLLRMRGTVLSVPYLLENVWGYDPRQYSDPHTVEVHVSSLRRKIGARLGRLIVTVPSLGYRFDG